MNPLDLFNSTYFDRYINCELIYEHKVDSLDPMSKATKVTTSLRKLKIKCPESGRKPRITFEYNRVPSNVCYRCTINITNLYLTVNAYDVSLINVTAGYKSDGGQHVQTLRCQVFSSFTPEAGPDGYTSFICLVAAADVNPFTDQPYSLIYQEETDAKTVISTIGEKIGINMILHDDGTVGNEPFSKEFFPLKSFSSGYALISDLQNRLNRIAESKNCKVTSTMFNNEVHYIVLDSNGQVKEPATAQTLVYDLTLVNSVDWNAGTITIKAPWIPEIKPGSLFKISPTIYNGASLPNIVAQARGQVDKDGLYYVITQQVKFSTEGSTNEMIITGVPKKNSPINNGATTETIVSSEAYKKMYEKAVRQDIEIKFGEAQKDVQRAKDAARDLTGLTLTLSGTTAYIVKSGDSLSGLCGSKQQPNGQAGFALPDLVGKVDGVKKTVPGSQAWYPLIMVLTNTQVKQDKISRPRWFIDMNDPDNIQEDTRIVIPNNITWKQIQQQYRTVAVNCMRYCHDYYMGATQGKNSWAKSLSLAADILEKGTEVQ